MVLKYKADIHGNLPSLNAMLDENADINANVPSLDIHEPKIGGPSLDINGLI